MTSLTVSTQIGEIKAQACLAKAADACPNFSERARAALLECLRTKGQCSGEEMTNYALGRDIVPHDDRAFGGVFRALARKGLIIRVGFCPRAKGHGTAGGSVWKLAA